MTEGGRRWTDKYPWNLMAKYLVNPVILSKKVILSMNFLANTSCQTIPYSKKTNPIFALFGPKTRIRRKNKPNSNPNLYRLGNLGNLYYSFASSIQHPVSRIQYRALVSAKHSEDGLVLRRPGAGLVSIAKSPAQYCKEKGNIVEKCEYEAEYPDTTEKKENGLV
jgi:hypothetical protein